MLHIVVQCCSMRQQVFLQLYSIPYREAAQRLSKEGQGRQRRAEVPQQARQHAAYRRDAEQRAHLGAT
jgi:hypothetical protein